MIGKGRCEKLDLPRGCTAGYISNISDTQDQGLEIFHRDSVWHRYWSNRAMWDWWPPPEANGGDLRIFLDDMVKVFHTGQEIQAYNLGAGQVESFSTGKHRRFGRSGIPPKSSSPAKICWPETGFSDAYIDSKPQRCQGKHLLTATRQLDEIAAVSQISVGNMQFRGVFGISHAVNVEIRTAGSPHFRCYFTTKSGSRSSFFAKKS